MATASGDSHAVALGRAQQLVSAAEAAADGREVVRQAWAAVSALKDARNRTPADDRARDQRSPLYVRAVEAVKKTGQWAEARRLAVLVRFDRDARRADRIALAKVVEQANRELGLASTPGQCDLVMKGGVTSGIVYPRALKALSRRYTFRRIGGASVGAVAAAAAAAAEYSRQVSLRTGATEAPNQGFEGLEELPDELGATVPDTGRSKLLSLFQPRPETRPAMDVLLAVLGGRTAPGKVLAAAAAVLKAQPLPFLASLVLGGLLVWTAAGTDQALLLTLSVLAAFAALVLGIIGSVAALGAGQYRAISDNGFGICRGYSASERPEALTAWMTDLFDRLAGLVDHPSPLTFGMLREGAEGQPPIDLVVVTSNLTLGQPCRLPFFSEWDWIPKAQTSRPFVPKRYFFKLSEFVELFPENVVDHLTHHGSVKHRELLAAPNLDPRWKEALPRFEAMGYLPLPDGDDLPVVVAVRMSLSFPVLLSMVPLHAVDESLEAQVLQLEPCWFSDGGVCSNLPIHFFDSLIPCRPTFAINLAGESPSQKVDPDDQAKNVWMPSSNLQGLSGRWNRFGPHKLMGFVGALIDTMQNWVDGMQMTSPGYRDRIVHIRHTADEGGLNLTMPRKRIDALSRRGEKAGERILQDFDWDNHLWIRLRSVLDISDVQLTALRNGALADPKMRALFARLVQEHTGKDVPDDNAPLTQAQADELPALLHLFEELLGAEQQSYCDDAAPDPTPELRVRPRL